LEKRDTPAHAPVTSEPKGLLDPGEAARRLRLTRVHPSPDLARLVEHHWTVTWDLTDQAPHVQRTLPYPCVHVVFDRGKTAVFGVMRGTFEYVLEGRGRVLGVRFRPGAFRRLLGRSLTTLTDRTASLAEVFGVDDAAAEAEVLSAPDEAAMVRAAEDILRRSPGCVVALAEADATVELIHDVLRRLEADAEITRVDQLAALAGTGVRDLQRIFAEYVGVSPKWVIRRARLHEVASRLARGEAVDLTRLSHELGYFDQAHLSRDFKNVVGRSPSDYQRTASRP
jgi:AraC-like DNA-binding protein